MGVRKLSEQLSSPVKFFGIEFAPRDVPWERRIQVLSILVYPSFFVFWGFVSYPLLFVTLPILLYLQCYRAATLFAAVVFPYLIWMWLYDMESPHRGSRQSKFVRDWGLWKRYNEYFPIKLVRTGGEFDPKKNYLFCGHPHGFLCLGLVGYFSTNANGVNEVFPGFRFSVLTFDATFMFPFTREVLMWLGLCSASRRSMNYLLGQEGGGNIAVLIPGGAPEALDFCPGKNILQLKDRKGFVKVALQNGSPLVPVFSFGENRAYSQIPNPRGSLLRTLQDAFQQLFMIPPVLFYGRGILQYSLGFLPKRHPINVVVGAPIPVEKVQEPTRAQIEELHEKYVKALTDLYNENKEKYSATPEDVLVIT